MIERKLFEKVDDNPGDYFGMLVEGYDSTYASVMKQADSDAQKLRDSWEKDGKSLFDTLSELGYESDYEDSPYMFKDADGGNTIVFDFRPINSFEDYVTYFVVDKDNRIPDGWTKTKLMIDFWKDKNESLKEDSEYKTLAKLSKGLEVISYPYGYAVSDGYAADRFVVRDGKYIFDDGRFSLSDKDKEKILSLIKKGVIEESLKEDYYDKRLVQKLYSMWFSKEQAEWLAKNAKDYAESLAYGHTTTDDLIEAEEYVNSKMKKQEAIKEDKFVSRDKMSKKDRKELDSQKRNTWGSTNPVTRVQPNKKAYDRKIDKKELKENKSPKSKKLVEDLHTEKQIKLLQSRLSDFRKSWINLRDTLEYVDYEVASSIDDGYPFEMSFDELSLEVTDWLEDCIARCDWLYDEAQNGRFGNLTEDKFVPQDKMSKKAQKELNDKKRGTWGNTNPVTKVQPNKKAYDRKRDKKELAESTFENALKAKDGKIFMDTVGEKLTVLGNGMQHLSGNERIKFDDIVYYYKLLEDAYKAYGDYLKNSSSLKLRPWNYEDTTWNYPDEMYND